MLEVVAGGDATVPGGIELEVDRKGMGMGMGGVGIGVGIGVGKEGEDGVQATVLEGLLGMERIRGVVG